MDDGLEDDKFLQFSYPMLSCRLTSDWQRPPRKLTAPAALYITKFHFEQMTSAGAQNAPYAFSY